MMDRRIETVAKEGIELVAEYVTEVTASSAKLVERLLDNATTLVRGVIHDGTEVVRTAASAFVDDEK